MAEQNGDKITVVIVDDVPETREMVKKLLYFETDIEVVGAAGAPQEGVEMSEELSPDIVLMDINFPPEMGMDGVAAAEQIADLSPASQIIMVSVQAESGYLRRAMLAGAREFLTKPFSGDELVTAIRRVHDLRPKQPLVAAAPPMEGPAAVPEAVVQGRILTVYSPKGGSGTSLLVSNLGIALAQESGEEVVLVDCNPQFGDLGVLLNLPPSRTIVDLADHPEALDEDLVASVLQSHDSGVKVLLAPPRPEMAELVTPDLLRGLLGHLATHFRYVVADTASSLNDLTLTALDAAERIVLVITPDIPSVKNAKLFFELMEGLGDNPQRVLMVLNQADRKTGIRQEDIAANIKHPILLQVPSDNGIVATSINEGVPLMVGRINAPAARSIASLAKEVLEALAEADAAAGEAEAVPAGGLLGRIRR